ncbi:MAG: hypothetical protein V4686_03585 [Patescibacteria group bacterium]
MIKNINIKSFLIILFACAVTCPSTVFSAQVLFDIRDKDVHTNELFEMGIFLNTKQADLNAIEAEITFPSDLVEIKKINTSSSIVNLWIEQPKHINNKITLSGIMPGGYNGEQGLIGTVTFLAKKDGMGSVFFNKIKVLQNDGKGTAAIVTPSSVSFNVKKLIGTPAPLEVIQDREPPEDFTPYLVQDQDIFEGKWFLVFTTQDKSSGIKHYEVKEGKNPFVIATSPYLLENQDLHKNITIKAVDENGNERVVIIPAEESVNMRTLSIIGILTVVFVLYRILWKKYKKPII